MGLKSRMVKEAYENMEGELNSRRLNIKIGLQNVNCGWVKMREVDNKKDEMMRMKWSKEVGSGERNIDKKKKTKQKNCIRDYLKMKIK